jgi:hypothetical protein
LPEQRDAAPNYIALAITGLLSLVVGVSSGLLLDVFRERAPDLTYAIAGSGEFAGQIEQIGIAVITISNPGKREVEDLHCELSFPTAIIKEYKIGGLSTAGAEIQKSEHAVELKVPYLNPHETFTVQLLLTPLAGGTATPEIQLRGKGIIGHQERPTKNGKDSKDLSMLLVTAATTAMVIPVFLFGIRKIFPRFIFTVRHMDDQRDVFGYVLGSYGLMTAAAKVRGITRAVSYWALVDLLTEEWMQAQDPDLIRKGISALQRLLEYAEMQETTRWLIQIDIARLASLVGEVDLAKASLQAALCLGHKVILRRVAYDDALKAAYEAIKSAKS